MSRVTGSFVTIGGPPAGLIVVNLAAVESLGQGDMLAGYKFALAAFLMAGLIQMILGFLKVGKFGDFFPSAAVHGMLAAIGIIIIVKQLFVALDYTQEANIDFDTYPVFSDKFVLKGPNQQAIRSFFHPGIIRKVEQYPHFHGE